ncbi:MAG TPA: septal ring lytic transglycosylase RlpA family protein [Xanthobacteraceae bacterium]|nr:septal ring lytic transglycosylase RlpA family protein [Xanthobacteraceae bacterium]
MGKLVGGISASKAGRALVAAATCLVVANCSSAKFGSRVDPKYGVSSSPRVVKFGEAVPKGGGTYRVGKPYVVAGRTYTPRENPNYRAEGLASWYGDDFHGRLTANGEVFDMTSITAAHPTMPLPSYARVTNLRNGKSIVVRVNDRGPFHENRLIDVSNRAAKLLDFHANGVAPVRVEYVGRASLEGSDDRYLMATLRTGEPAPAPSAVRVASAAPFVPEMSAPPRTERRSEVATLRERPLEQPARTNVAMAELAPAPIQRTAHVAAANNVGAPTAGSRATTAYAAERPSDAMLMSGRGLY